MQPLEHLGLTVDLDAGTFSVSGDKLARLHCMASDTTVSAKQRLGLVPNRTWPPIKGLAQSVGLAIAQENVMTCVGFCFGYV